MKSEQSELVYRIEDAVYPADDGRVAPLPANSNFSKVVDSVVSTLLGRRLRHSEELAASLRDHYFRSETVSLISDVFWLCLLHMEQPETLAQVQGSLLDRVASNYIEIFWSLLPGQRDLLLSDFHDGVSQAVFYSMFFAFPKSRSKLNTDQKKRELLSIVAKYLVGLPLSSYSYQHWNLDLGNGNVLLQPIEARPVKPKLLGKSPIVRKLTPVRYSPLVGRYLVQHKYEQRNAVSSWKLRCMERNASREKQADQAFSYFRELTANRENRLKRRENSSTGGKSMPGLRKTFSSQMNRRRKL